MKTVIYTLSIHDKPPEFLKYTIPTIINYSNLVGADFKWITSTQQMGEKLPRAKEILDYAKTCPHFYKIWALIDFVYSQYDRMMIIDEDILVRHNAFNLFSMYKPGTFLTSQHVGESGAKHLCISSSDENENEEVDLVQISKILSKQNVSEESIKHLSNNLRNSFNSGLYVIDKLAANMLAQTFADDFFDEFNQEQGYLHAKIAEAKIEISEIPEKCHANPCIKKRDLENFLVFDRHTDYFHFAGMSIQKKEKVIRTFYEAGRDLFCSTVIIVGSTTPNKEQKSKEKKKPKIGIIQLGDDAFSDDFSHCCESVKRYCEKHNYDHILYKSRAYKDCYSNHQKSKVILDHFNDYDYIMWIDLDAAIIDDCVRIEDIISLNPRDFYYCEDPSEHVPLNSGVLIFKTTPYCKDILSSWWETRPRTIKKPTPEDPQPWRGDQAELVRVLAKKNHSFCPLEGGIMNRHPKKYKTGDFILHFMGYTRKDSDRHVGFCFEKHQTLNLPKYWKTFSENVPTASERDKYSKLETVQGEFLSTFDFQPKHIDHISQEEITSKSHGCRE